MTEFTLVLHQTPLTLEDHTRPCMMKYLPTNCFKSQKDKPGDKTFLVFAKCTHCPQSDATGCWQKWRAGSFEKCKTCAVLSRGRPQHKCPWAGGQLRRFTPDGQKAHFHRYGGLLHWVGGLYPKLGGNFHPWEGKKNPSWNLNTKINGMTREVVVTDQEIESRSKNQPECLKQILTYLEEKGKTDKWFPWVYLRGDLCQVRGKDGKTAYEAIEEFMTRMPADGDKAHRGNFAWLMKRLGDANIGVDFKREFDPSQNKIFLYLDVRGGTAA